MKLEQQEQAQNLFFQTDMSKTDIAEAVGVNRRTITQWVNENNWQRIKTSAEHMPSMIAENLYVVMAHLAENLITETRMGRAITEGESRTVQRLTQTISKLKNRSTLNENLEMLKYFMDFVNDTEPAAIDTISRLVNKYIASRAKTRPSQFMSPKMNEYGYLPAKDGATGGTAQEARELQLDIEEMMSDYEAQPLTLEPTSPEPQPTSTVPSNNHTIRSNNNPVPTPQQPEPYPTKPVPNNTIPNPSEPQPQTTQKAPLQSAFLESFNPTNPSSDNKYHHLNRATRRKLSRSQKQKPKTTA